MGSDVSHVRRIPPEPRNYADVFGGFRIRRVMELSTRRWDAECSRYWALSGKVPSDYENLFLFVDVRRVFGADCDCFPVPSVINAHLSYATFSRNSRGKGFFPAT